MRSFLITVDGQSYTGLFPESFDAVIDALERHPGANRISVRQVNA